MPVYKGSHLLRGALESIYRQGFDFYEIIIGDDTPPDAAEELSRTRDIVASFGDKRIKYSQNARNLGYALNLRDIVSRASGDILFLMAQDDFLAKDALSKTHNAFLLDDDIGVVTRPFYCFMDDMLKPVRAIFPHDSQKDSILSLKDGEEVFRAVFGSVGQLTGLAYRREFLDVRFNEECFPAHIYPFAGIFRSHKCVFLKDFTVAVGIRDSQTRSVSSIYSISPTDSWLRMYDTVFAGDKFREQRLWGRRHMATHFLGLAQLKNYAEPGVLAREIRIMAKAYRPNLFNPLFYLFSLGALLVPRKILAPVVDLYKDSFNSRKKELRNIKFNY
jgi:glycosyltransferase involved in cell wall biosynthesis